MTAGLEIEHCGLRKTIAFCTEIREMHLFQLS